MHRALSNLYGMVHVEVLPSVHVCTVMPIFHRNLPAARPRTDRWLKIKIEYDIIEQTPQFAINQT